MQHALSTLTFVFLCVGLIGCDTMPNPGKLASHPLSPDNATRGQGYTSNNDLLTTDLGYAQPQKPGTNPTAGHYGANQAGTHRQGQYTAEMLREMEEENRQLAAEEGGWTPEVLFEDATQALGYGQNKEIAEKLFAQGRETFDRALQLQKTNAAEAKKVFSSAGKIFSKAADRGEGTTVHANSLFYAGESLFAASEYKEALVAYRALLKFHETTIHLKTTRQRLFAIAKYWEDVYEKQQKSGGAAVHFIPNYFGSQIPPMLQMSKTVEVYEDVINPNAGSEIAIKSLRRIGDFYFRHRYYDEACDYYKLLIEQNGDKDRYAYVQAIKSHLNSYQGAEYTPRPLTTAKKLCETALTLFPLRKTDADRKFQAEIRKLHQARRSRTIPTALVITSVGLILSYLKKFGESNASHPPNTPVAFRASVLRDASRRLR